MLATDTGLLSKLESLPVRILWKKSLSFEMRGKHSDFGSISNMAGQWIPKFKTRTMNLLLKPVCGALYLVS